VDLPRSVSSGLRHGINLLKNIDGIATIYLTAEDVVRHRLVKAIINAYSLADERRKMKEGKQEEEE